MQVTASALASRRRGSRSRKLALRLVREGVAHVIASDTHARGGGRASLADAVEALRDEAPLRAPLDGHRRAGGDPRRRAAPGAPVRRARARSGACGLRRGGH